jgi:hypothetical protein
MSPPRKLAGSDAKYAAPANGVIALGFISLKALSRLPCEPPVPRRRARNLSRGNGYFRQCTVSIEAELLGATLHAFPLLSLVLFQRLHGGDQLLKLVTPGPHLGQDVIPAP